MRQASDGNATTRYLLFDEAGALLEGDAATLADLAAPDAASPLADRDRLLRAFVGRLVSFDGRPVASDAAFLADAVARWARAGTSAIEAHTRAGRWALLTMHPRVEGGEAFVSVDITRMKHDETAFREHAEIHRCITDSHPLPVWVVDAETLEVYYESVDASRLLGRKWNPDKRQSLTTRESETREMAEIAQVVAREGIVRDREVAVTRADGTVVWCSANFRGGTYRGRPAIIIGVLDITQRKKREEMLEFLIEHHPLPVWMNDSQTGEVIYQSHAAQSLFGWQRDTGGAGPKLRDYFVDDARFLELTGELFRVGEAENYEAMLKQADGSEFWAIGNATVTEFQGRQVTLAGIADVTRQKERDAEVTKARVMLADAIESLSEGFALYDEDQRLVLCNQRYREMNHYREEVVSPGAEWSELLRRSVRHGVFPDAIGREDEWIRERISAGIEFLDDYEINPARGCWRSVSIHPTELGGFVVTVIDISERKKLEEAEKNANALVHQVLDACPSPTRMSTLDGETLYRNAASIALYSARPNGTDSFVDPRDRKRLIDKLVAGGKVDDFRVKQYTADSEVFWASISSRLIDFQGRPVIVSNTTDISALIAAQDEVERVNDRLTDAIESLSEGFALYDAHDRLVLANSKYRELNAMTADILVPGVNWFDFLRLGAERGQFLLEGNSVEEWIAERALDRNEFRQREMKQADGRWSLVSNCPTRDGGFVVTRVDITERKRAEIAEREADALVRRVLEACPVNIQMTRDDGTLLYRSPATFELLGEVKSAGDYYVNAEDRRVYLERLHRDGFVDDYEAQLRAKDGRTIWCSISSRLIDFRGEDVIVGHIFDLTDRLQMQEELERQRETLHQNEKLSALGELLAGVAHELNNPLSIVLGQSLLLKESSGDPTVEERSEKIINAADRCARIVKTFLAMARQGPARTRNASIASIVESAVAVAGYAIHSSHIALDIDVAADLPAVWADADQLSQVFINLLVNAEQALRHKDGERRITLSARHVRARDRIEVRVADTGPGIAADILPRIFEPFFTTKDIGAGTGIGLSFCHRIVQAHNGTLHAERGAGSGSVFTVTLPVSRNGDADAPAPEAATRDGRALCCLLVEDEKEVGALIAEILNREGIRVMVAHSGEEALYHLGRCRYDVVLSDLKMPNMDGRRLFGIIEEKHAELVDRLGFITGDTMSPDARKFLVGAKRPYLEKPIRPEELTALVTQLVGAGRTPTEHIDLANPPAVS